MILMPSDYGPTRLVGGCQAHACQMPAILLWMHNGLGYIYGQCRVKRDEPARKAKPQGAAPQKEANMSIEQFIDNEVKSNDVVLFMKGTPQFPQCGFSGQVVQILDHVGVGYKGLNVLERPIRTGRPFRSSTSRASSSAAAISSARCSRPANCSSCLPTRASRSTRRPELGGAPDRPGAAGSHRCRHHDIKR